VHGLTLGYTSASLAMLLKPVCGVETIGREREREAIRMNA